jgi:hypothetical protein
VTPHPGQTPAIDREPDYFHDELVAAEERWRARRHRRRILARALEDLGQLRAALRALESGGAAREVPYTPRQQSDVVALTPTKANFETRSDPAAAVATFVESGYRRGGSSSAGSSATGSSSVTGSSAGGPSAGPSADSSAIVPWHFTSWPSPTQTETEPSSW